MSQGLIVCLDPAVPVINSGLVECSDTSTPYISPVLYGLADLAWSDVSLLVGALLTSCALAVGFNLLGHMFIKR